MADKGGTQGGGGFQGSGGRTPRRPGPANQANKGQIWDLIDLTPRITSASENDQKLQSGKNEPGPGTPINQVDDDEDMWEPADFFNDKDIGEVDSATLKITDAAEYSQLLRLDTSKPDPDPANPVIQGKGKGKMPDPTEFLNDDAVIEAREPIPIRFINSSVAVDRGLQFEEIELDPDSDLEDGKSSSSEPEVKPFCLERDLTHEDVHPEDPRIKLDGFQAMNLTGNPELLVLPESGHYSTSLSVFDKSSNLFDMTLSDYSIAGWIGYSISGEWRQFVRRHRLKVGDKVYFHQKENEHALDHYFYEISYVRSPVQPRPQTGVPHFDLNLSVTPPVEKYVLTRLPVETKYKPKKIPLETKYTPKITPFPVDTEYTPNMVPIFDWPPKEQSLPSESRLLEEKSPDHKKKPGPGSRVLRDDDICISKTLSAYEVDNGNETPRLFLDFEVAGDLIGCPDIEDKYPVGALLENLVVFDVEDQQYDMLLSHFKLDTSSVACTIDAGWQRFVQTHNLKGGDKIFFYRLVDETVHDEPYYVVTYVRKDVLAGPSGSGSGPDGSGVSTDGSGGSEDGTDGSAASEDGTDGSAASEDGPGGSGVSEVIPGGNGEGPSGSATNEVGLGGSGVSDGSPGGSGVSEVVPCTNEVVPSGSGDVPGGSGQKEES